MNRFRLQAWALGAAVLLMLTVPVRGNLITNGSFTSFTGTSTTDPDNLIYTNNASTGVATQFLTGWVGGTLGSASGSYPGLDCLVLTANQFCNYATFAYNPGAPPGGGNALMFDADPAHSSTLSQSVYLYAGMTYHLSFYQAASYQSTFTGDPTSQLNFKVTLGSQTLTAPSPTPISGNANAAAWQLVNLTFTAATTGMQTLSFAANGPSGGPPVLLLGDVNLVAPEPATWMMMALGGLFLAVGKIRMGHKKKPTVE